MDYSAANHALWNIIIQMGLIAGAILLANLLRQRVSLIRRSLIPIAVLRIFSRCWSITALPSASSP